MPNKLNAFYPTRGKGEKGNDIIVSPTWQSWMRNSYRAELERLCAKVRGLHRRRAIPAQVTDEMVRVYRKAGDAFQEAVEQLQQGG